MSLSSLRIPRASSFDSFSTQRAQRKAPPLFLGAPDTAQEKEAEKIAAGGVVQLKPSESLGQQEAVPDEIAGSIAEQRGGGAPLPETMRSRMEQAFGRNLSSVRIHDNHQSDALNQELSSAAFTTGQDIFFRGGQYQPNRPEGQSLLMHELTHTMQSQAQPQLVQRALWSVAKVKEKVAIGWRWRSDAYGAILKAFELWHEGVVNESVPTQVYFLQSLLEQIDDYLASKEAKQQGARENARNSRDTRITNMRSVRDNVSQELQTIKPGYDLSPEAQQPVLRNMDRGQLPMVPDGRVVGEAQNTLYEVFRDPNDDSNRGFFKEEMTENSKIEGTKGHAAGIPRMNPNQTGRSVGAYRVDQLLGGGLIPETSYSSMTWSTVDEKTKERTDHEAFGSTMDIVENATPGNLSLLSGQFAQYTLTDAHRPELSKLYLLDLIIGQVDRHERNYMVETDGSHVYGIDNDLAFGKNFQVNPSDGTANIATFGKHGQQIKVDRTFAERIINLANHPDWLRQALQNLNLTPDEINAAVARLKNLATYLVKRLAQADNLW